MQSFGIAKFFLALFIVVGWVIVGISVVGFFLTGHSLSLVERLGFLALAVVGLMLVGVAQTAVAQIATAENTKEILNLLKNYSLKENVPRESVLSQTAAPAPHDGKARPEGNFYKGYEILGTKDGVRVEGASFNSAFAAKAWIDDQVKS